MLAGVRAVGCRRVGGGLTGAPFESNVPEGAALAVSLAPGLIIFEGSGSCIPPVQVDRTLCIVGPGAPEPLSGYSLLRADLVLAREGRRRRRTHCPRAAPRAGRAASRGARVACSPPGAGSCALSSRS